MLPQGGLANGAGSRPAPQRAMLVPLVRVFFHFGEPTAFAAISAVVAGAAPVLLFDMAKFSGAWRRWSVA